MIFLQRATSVTSNERILQQVIFCNEQLLEQVMSDFLQQTTSTRSNEQVLKQATSEFQRVKSNKQKVTPSINYAISLIS